jgi:hypothetical protein
VRQDEVDGLVVGEHVILQRDGGYLKFLFKGIINDFGENRLIIEVVEAIASRDGWVLSVGTESRTSKNIFTNDEWTMFEKRKLRRGW